MSSTSHCPACRHGPLDQVVVRSVVVDVCPRCHGQWFDAGELEIVFRGSRSTAGLVPGEGDLVLAPSTGPSALSCPRCHTVLGSHRFGPHPGLWVQACSQCRGLWLERGSLERHRAHRRAEAAASARLAEEQQADRNLTFNDWLFELCTDLPVEVNVEPLRFPWATTGLLIINVIVFLLLTAVDDPNRRTEILVTFGTVPDRLLLGRNLWSPITSLFLHADMGHLIGNIYFLYMLGDNVEDTLGPGHYLGLYFGTGVAAAFTQAALQTVGAIPAIGASGAIAGVLAAYVLLYPQAKLSMMIFFYQFKSPVFAFVGLWLLFQVVCAMAGVQGVGWFAHIGGFATGFAWIAGARERGWVRPGRPTMLAAV